MFALTMPKAFGLAVLAGFAGLPLVYGQASVLPSDPMEIVTTAPHVPGTQERNNAVSLLMKAKQNRSYGLGYDVKTTFVASGPVISLGTGDMDEVSIPLTGRRWTGHLANFSLTRLIPVPASMMYDLGSSGPIPLRLQMARMNTVGSMGRIGPASPFRIVSGSLEGETLTCLLAFGTNLNASGRDWSESEYCIDPVTQLIRIISDAPGIYEISDYTNPTVFHGHTIPGGVTVYAAGKVVLDETLTVKDPDPPDPALWTITPEMFTGGVNLVQPTRSILSRTTGSLSTASSSSSTAGQPVIVHAMIAPDGHVVEAEALQMANPALAQSALDLVKNTQFGPATVVVNSPNQREIYVTVQ